MNHITKIVYINLDRRTDRREEIEAECLKMRIPTEKVVRFSAIEHDPGFVGCSKSHLAVLKMAREENWFNVLIFEDDFQFLVSADSFESNLREFFSLEQPYDVLLLSYSLHQREDFMGNVGRTRNTQTASGYLVHHRFYDHLIQNIEESVHLNELHACSPSEYAYNSWSYAFDQYWKRLQSDPSNVWLFFLERIGRQRAGYSDLVKRFVDYNC